jgi:hypothetical protein
VSTASVSSSPWSFVQSDTLLRTEDQLLTEVMSELGFRKRGKRIVEAITEAIRLQRSRA